MRGSDFNEFGTPPMWLMALMGFGVLAFNIALFVGACLIVKWIFFS